MTVYHAGCTGWNVVLPHPHGTWSLKLLPFPHPHTPTYGILDGTPVLPRPHISIYDLLAGTPCVAPPTCSVLIEAPALPIQGIASDTPLFPRPYMALPHPQWVSFLKLLPFRVPMCPTWHYAARSHSLVHRHFPGTLRAFKNCSPWHTVHHPTN